MTRHPLPAVHPRGSGQPLGALSLWQLLHACPGLCRSWGRGCAHPDAGARHGGPALSCGRGQLHSPLSCLLAWPWGGVEHVQWAGAPLHHRATSGAPPGAWRKGGILSFGCRGWNQGLGHCSLQPRRAAGAASSSPLLPEELSSLPACPAQCTRLVWRRAVPVQSLLSPTPPTWGGCGVQVRVHPLG